MNPLAAYDALTSAASVTPGVTDADLKKLASVRPQLVSGNLSPVCKAIDGFVQTVNRNTPKKISAANAAILIRKSQDADAAIGC
jgi:hypothetical protein